MRRLHSVRSDHDAPEVVQPAGEGAVVVAPLSRRFLRELSRQPARMGSALLATVVGLAVVSPTTRTAPAAPSPSPVAHAGAQPALAGASASVASVSVDPGAAASPGPAHPPAPGDRVAYDGLARRAAGEVCPGLPPPVLTAIAEVESRLGTRAVTSGRGAKGPMQFLPATWAAYARDGNADGRTDVHHPVDAVFTAAGYLCANGGADPRRLRSAVWHYNRSTVYVSRVLTLAGLR